MNLEPLPLQKLLRRYGLQPHKGLGQNFLVDESALAKIAAAAQITNTDAVLEVGAGLGSLTRHLAQSARRVVAVEIDRQLIEALKTVVGELPNVDIVQGDMLELDPAELMQASGYLVAANIPYYITSALIRHLLESALKPARIVLTIQEEVAQRICAQPGDMSLLALSVQVYGQPQVVEHIPSGAFFPRPEVDSAVLRVDLYPEPRIPEEQLDDFFRLIKAGFSQKRKMLRNTLAGSLGWKPAEVDAFLTGAGIDPQRRAQTLSLPEWSQLTAAYAHRKLSG